jgi:hypothetical protein
MTRKILFSAVLGLFATAMTQAAPIFLVTTAGGATATADFTLSAGQVVLVLTDTTVNPNDVSLNLSAIHFMLTGATGGSLTGASSSLVTVDNGGVPTSGGAVTTPAAVGWILSNPTPGNYLLDVLSPGGTGPAHTIIGTPDGSGNYSNANGSIAGNGPHNSFLAQSATFTFTIPGVTANTVVSSATFQFGTVDGVVGDPGTLQGVPEPLSLTLVGGGLVALGLTRARRSRRA